MYCGKIYKVYIGLPDYDNTETLKEMEDCLSTCLFYHISTCPQQHGESVEITFAEYKEDAAEEVLKNLKAATGQHSFDGTIGHLSKL